jgi:hypothetical protein
MQLYTVVTKSTRFGYVLNNKLFYNKPVVSNTFMSYT